MINPILNQAYNQSVAKNDKAGMRANLDLIQPYIDEFCELRRATTEREKRAFFWFFDLFLECVCVARPWRNVKKTTLVLKADDSHCGKLVTKIDGAFALLLINN